MSKRENELEKRRTFAFWTKKCTITKIGFFIKIAFNFSAQSVRSADLVDGVSKVDVERRYGSPEGGKEEVDTLPFQKQRKRSKLRQLVKGQLRKHLDSDQGGKGKLKKIFGIVKEAEAEFELLKKIMASDKKE